MEFQYNDGGRSKYFRAEHVGDCVTRAISIATGRDYKEVYDTLKQMAKRESVKHHRGHKQSSVRDGVFRETWKRYLRDIGWVHHSTCEIGSKADKLKLTQASYDFGRIPKGKVIIQLSKHLTCLVDGVINDTYDCSCKMSYDEDGNIYMNNERCIYGYWTAPTEEQVKERQEQEAQAQALIQKQNDHIAQTKEQINVVKAKYQPKLTKLEKKIKELQHELKIETNRMNREVDKIKKERGDAFMQEWAAVAEKDTITPVKKRVVRL